MTASLYHSGCGSDAGIGSGELTRHHLPPVAQPEDDHGPGGELVAGRVARDGRPSVHRRVEQALPLLRQRASRQGEADRLVVRAEQQEQRVADDRLAPRVDFVDLRAVQPHAEGPASAFPARVGHLAAVGREPGDVLARLAMLRPWKNRRRRSTGCSRRISIRLREVEEVFLLVGQLPVQPGDFVVLAVGVVVAVLRVAELVAGEQHRHAWREQQRRQEVALLPLAQLDDRRIVGRPFDAAVPAVVVVRRRRGCPRRWPRCASRCS